MNIGFDAKRAYLNFTGLGNYSRFIISAIQENYPDNQYFLFTPRANQHAEVGGLNRSNTQVITPSHNIIKGGLWRSWGIRFENFIQQLDIFHGLSGELPIGLPKHVGKIVTIHDLIFIRYPELYRPIDRFIYTLKAKRACQMADQVIAISEQTAQDVQDLLKIEASKIKVVYQGCHTNFKKQLTHAEIDRVKSKYHLPSEYILNIGTIEKRKNLVLLINALVLMPADNKIKLVVVGRKAKYFTEVMKLIHSHQLQGRITFLHQVDFEDLPAIYQGSQIFVYPSRFEGFGIPIVEAIESHVPVITSTGSCFREAGGPSSIYVDPDNAEGLAFEMERLLHDEVLVKEINSHSINFTKRFYPRSIATEMMDMYKGQ